LNVAAELELEMEDAGLVRRLSAVLKPDNEGLPRGTRLAMTAAGRSLRCRVVSDAPSTALSTLMALMRDITLFQEVWLLSRT